MCIRYRSKTTGFFELSQTLYSRSNESVELFGNTLSFSNNILAIASKNADIVSPATFDALATTFDNNFTLFAKTFIDTGVVYVYENIGFVEVCQRKNYYQTALTSEDALLMAMEL